MPAEIIAARMRIAPITPQNKMRGWAVGWMPNERKSRRTGTWDGGGWHQADGTRSVRGGMRVAAAPHCCTARRQTRWWLSCSAADSAECATIYLCVEATVWGLRAGTADEEERNVYFLVNIVMIMSNVNATRFSTVYRDSTEPNGKTKNHEGRKGVVAKLVCMS